MNLKNYIELSNITKALNPPCYIKDYHYFFKKITGGDENTYYFTHNKNFLNEYMYFFNIEKHKKKLKKLISDKKSDNEIFNELSADFDPQYPDIDEFIREITNGIVYAYGKHHILHKFEYVTDLVNCDYLVITDQFHAPCETEITYYKKYAKKIIFLYIGYPTIEGSNFIKFIKFSLNALGKPDPFYDSFSSCAALRFEKIQLLAKGPKKNPLNIGVKIF